MNVQKVIYSEKKGFKNGLLIVMAHGWGSEDGEDGEDAPPVFTLAIIGIMVLVAIFFFVLFCYVYKKHSVARQQIVNRIQQGVPPHFQQGVQPHFQQGGNTMMNPTFQQYNTDGKLFMTVLSLMYPFNSRQRRVTKSSQSSLV